MSQEVIGEVTIRSSQPEPVVAAASGGSSGSSGTAAAAIGNIANLIGPNFLSGPVTIRMSGDGREIMMGDVATQSAARIHLDGDAGDVTIRDLNGSDVFRFDSRFAVLDVGGLANEGDLRVRNNSDAVTIHLNGSSGDVILRNGDAAEDFDVASLEEAQPGTVMVLESDGRLRPCTAEHDRRVVGVVAGAGSYRPGVILDRRPEQSEARVPISIMGKTSVKADASAASIRVGDLLTTCATVGCARRVTDQSAAMGSVLGKALTPLNSGVDMVDMLISLQ